MIQFYQYPLYRRAGTHPSNKFASTMAAGPPVRALAKRASPQLCGVWFGLDPEE
jgi:hypothetical protein